LPGRSAKQMGSALIYGPGVLRELCADLRRQKPHVLHIQCVSGNARYALMAKRRLGLPLVVTLQGELTMDANRIFERSAFVQRTLRAVLTEADVITACSAKTLSDAESFYGR